MITDRATTPQFSRQPARFDRERRLLLHCLLHDTQVQPLQTDTLRLLVQEHLDWTYITETAIQHRIHPLLYWALRGDFAAAVPPEHMAILQTGYQETTRYNLLLSSALRTLLQQLTTHGIRAVPYKGPILSQQLYRNVSLRAMRDLDIVIHPADLPAVSTMLIDMGYQLTEAAATHHRIFDRDRDTETAIRVEVHTSFIEDPSILPPHHPEFERFWDRLKPIRFQGIETVTFAPEDLVLLLCLHGSKHLWSDLVWVADVAALVRQCPDLNWDAILSRAKHLRATRFLAVGLLVCHQLLAAPVPDAILIALRNLPRARAISEALCADFFIPRDQNRQTEWRAYWREIRLREGLFPKVWHLWRLINQPSPRDLAWLRLPKSIAFLYIFLRPLRVIWQYGNERLKSLMVKNHD